MTSLSNQSLERFLDLSISLRKHYATGLGLSMVVPASFLFVALWGEGSLAAAWRIVSGDWLIVLAVTTSVAVSTSIGSYARELSRSTSAMTCTATGSVTSTIAMVSCCLHHATDALAAASIVLGGSAVFLLRYRVEFVGIGLAVNAFGTGLMLRQIFRYRRKLENS